MIGVGFGWSGCWLLAWMVLNLMDEMLEFGVSDGFVIDYVVLGVLLFEWEEGLDEEGEGDGLF